jgi:hypothetical protein
MEADSFSFKTASTPGYIPGYKQSTYRYSNGALVVQSIADDQCKELFAQINKLTVLQDCASWLDSDAECGGGLYGKQLRVCYIAGTTVIVGYIIFYIDFSEMWIDFLCALVPRICVGVALMHAAVVECIARHGVTHVKLMPIETAKSFYVGLTPRVMTRYVYEWHALDLLQTLASRVTSCSVPADSFWLRAFQVYAEEYVTRNGPINDPRLRIASAMKDEVRAIASFTKTVQSDHKDFAILLAKKLPEFALKPTRKRGRESESRGGHDDDDDDETSRWLRSLTVPPITFTSATPTMREINEAKTNCDNACFYSCPAHVRIGNTDGVSDACARMCEAAVNSRLPGAGLGGRGRDIQRGRSGSKNRRSSRKSKPKRRGSSRKTRTKRRRSSHKTRTKRRGSGSSR